MSEIKKASVGRNDMQGSAALDFYESFLDLQDYAKRKGIDTETYNPIGLEVFYDEDDYFDLTFIVIDRKNDSKNENGLIPVIEISVSESKANFEEQFKSLNISLMMKGKERSEYDVIKSIDLSDSK